jgi:hypothetical protein
MEEYESIKRRPVMLFEKVFSDFEKPPEVVIMAEVLMQFLESIGRDY